MQGVLGCQGEREREGGGGERERSGGWRSRGGPAAEQIPGLIDGTTGALDFPRVARAFPSFPLTPRSHPHPPSRLSSVTHDPGAVVHPSGCGKAQEGPGRATREQLCHWAVVRVTWPRDFLPSVLHGAALPAVISATSHQFNPRGGEDISSPRVRDIFFGDFFSLPRKGVCVCVRAPSLYLLCISSNNVGRYVATNVVEKNGLSEGTIEEAMEEYTKFISQLSLPLLLAFEEFWNSFVVNT